MDRRRGRSRFVQEAMVAGEFEHLDNVLERQKYFPLRCTAVSRLDKESKVYIGPSSARICAPDTLSIFNPTR
jgi:hypothetical protein